MGKIALSRVLFRLKGGFFILSAASTRIKTITTTVSEDQAAVRDNKSSVSYARLVMAKVSFFYIHV
jgi:hypothetical protein